MGDAGEPSFVTDHCETDHCERADGIVYRNERCRSQESCRSWARRMESASCIFAQM